ncbi:MAG TPA: SGNH/GDSL hydrolase family protein [Nitrospiraceae bacterium]|nr:SGNH/GDSL hydrolase family protein [Nitrospiraceae bacterium]
MLKTLTECHVSRAVGLGLFFFSSLVYRSQNREVFDLWSWPYVLIVMTAGLIFVMSLGHSWWCYRQLGLLRTRVSLAAVHIDLAILLWGVGYFLNGFEAPRNWGQIADLNLFGSSNPAAAVLLWSALLTAVLSMAERVVPRGRASRLGAIMLAVWITAVVLLLGEGGLRFWSIVAPEPQGYPTYTTAMWARKFTSFNHAGFRDQEHARIKSGETQRLLIIGDSLAFGWGLNQTEDRFGEQLAERLNIRTTAQWEVLNASLGDTDTLTHIRFLKAMQAYQPNVILLLYAFNDIDYLVPVTPREGPSEHMNGLLDRLSPVRLLFTNLFLFQELYVRLRALTYQLSPAEGDPYNDDAILNKHFQDLTRFVLLASRSGATVAIVPFDIKVTASPVLSKRYEHFVQMAIAHGLPIWSAGSELFAKHPYKALIVNKLDSHPNALAHRVLADGIVARLQTSFHGEVQVTRQMSQ